MGYRTLRECVDDLEASGQLVRVAAPIDPNLEMAEVQRRLFRAKAPAVYFANVVGCQFPMVTNLFGTMNRVRYIFRDSIDVLKRLVKLQADPTDLLRRPKLYLDTPWNAWRSWPRKVRTGPVLKNETTVDRLPHLKSWPGDGGAYVTLPQVYSEDPDRPGLLHSNLGMYRVQLSGGEYLANKEVGVHYQIHRGLGIHHAAAIRNNKKLRINVFVGGSPAMSVAAVMPMPEGISELSFAGVLGKRRVPMVCLSGQLPIYAEADFCISGYLDPDRQKPEGPFGDHLGYYSLEHDFPVMRVERVYHRDDAIWPFTVVGRPPQEDTIFGQLIHELVDSAIETKIPGVRAVHAVDAAGVHPLLLAVGSERYVPYEKRRQPRELLTQANAILGHGPLSLAKYLLIVDGHRDAKVDVNNVPEFLQYVLKRVDWRRDLHFQTRTTIDTLDYSGDFLNEGSKLVIAATDPVKRMLPVDIESRMRLPEDLGFSGLRVVLPGILAVEGPAVSGRCDTAVQKFVESYNRSDPINVFPLIVIVDDSRFVAASLGNFLWTVFTRSNPASDIYGIDSFVDRKHWGCHGSLVIDARSKPNHAPSLVEDPKVTSRVDSLAAPNGPLHGII